MRLVYQILEQEQLDIITLEEVKNFLRISCDYDNLLLKNLIQAAVDYAESFTNKFIYIRKIKCSVLEVERKINLRYEPFNKLLIAEKLLNGQRECIKEFIDIPNIQKPLLIIDYRYINNNITLEYSAGYGSCLPMAIKVGMLKHIAQMYELNNEQPCSMNEVSSLYFSYRKLKI